MPYVLGINSLLTLVYRPTAYMTIVGCAHFAEKQINPVFNCVAV